MDKKLFERDNLGKRDLRLATFAGIGFMLIYLIFSPRGLDPSLWDEMTVAAGIRPPAKIFHGLWCVLVSYCLGAFGAQSIAQVLRIIGAVVGGVSAFFVYLVVRQILASLVRVKSLEHWSWIAPLFSMLATICFCAGDAAFRGVSPVSSAAFQFLGLVFSLHAFLRFLKVGGLWRILISMLFAGFVAGETIVGLLLPGVYYVASRLALAEAINDKQKLDDDPGHLAYMPYWRMFFSFAFGFVSVVSLNIVAFVSHGGLEASEWSAFDLAFHYAVNYYGALASAASPIGWMLAVTFSLFPLVVSLVMFPLLSRNTEPIRFRIGIVLLLAGVMALVQCGILPYTRLWSFSSGAVEINSDFLECVFMLMTVITLALAASCFAIGCQEAFYLDEDDMTFKVAEPRGPVMRNLVQVIVIVCMLPLVFRIYRPVETELRSLVHDAVVETVRECGDAKFLFTDGRLDPGIELIGSLMGSQVKPLNMMSGPSAWDKHIRMRHFEEGSADRSSVEVGVPVLLRVWAGEMTNGMDNAAVQLGFEFWRRARKPLPKCSGFVAREKGLSDADAERGVATANNIAKRIIRAAKEQPHAVMSSALRSAVSAVSWRISRFARMRDDEQLANELDEWNDAVKHMMRLIDYERMRTFMQMTPYEGLRLSLRRADFVEARKYGATVLQIDPEDPEANFGTGMAFLMEEKYKDAEFYLERTLIKRPDEPAVLNNLSIIFRKTNRLDKALEYVKKAHELAPENEEISRTLKDTERAVENRKAALRSAFSK
ncbi:MAG: hypothetical protein IJG18_12160 [Kiritimatiellae bacterium]|nr:hypothetical protein [Kiritimatiellia bacterium]